MTLRLSVTNTIVLLFLLTVSTANAVPQRAINKFKSALSSCDRGMQMAMPKSRGSLRVLQSLLKRYKSNRNAAIALDETVKELETEFYTGSFFTVETSFNEAYQICENDFSEKVSNAEALIAEKIIARKARQQQQQARREVLIEQSNAAKRQVFLAINEYCTHYLRDPSATSLYEKYQTAKQKALELYPEIVKQFHEATILDRESGQEANFNRTVAAWFKYCEAAFTQQAQTMGPTPPPVTAAPVGPTPPPITAAPVSPTFVEEGPMPPSQVNAPTTTDMASVDETKTPQPTTSIDTHDEERPATTETSEGDDDDDEEYRQEMEAEYQKVIATMSEDRLRVLKDEKRLPDYVDDDDGNYKKAKTWQYEFEDENKCRTYAFKGNKLMRGKTSSGECPPF